jgi:hypothetical protein
MDNQAVMLSIVLNLVFEGRCDLSNVSPYIRDYIEGILQEFDEESEEDAEKLYWYAHATLKELSGGPDGKSMLH